MEKLILSKGTEIEIESGSSLSDIRVLSATKEDMLTTWDEMTDGNLADVQVVNGDGVVAARYTDLTLVKETSTITDDGVVTSFTLREKTDVEKRLDALEASQDDQDEAITEMMYGGEG